MRLTIKLVLLLLLFFSVNRLIARNSVLYSGIVQINTQDRTLGDIFTQITSQTGIRFSFNPQLVNTEKVIYQEITAKDLNTILSRLLPESVGYKQVGNHIIITAKTEGEISFPEAKILTEQEIIIEKNEKKSSSNQLIISNNENKLKKVDLSDTGILAYDCHNYVNLKNEDEMKKQLAALLVIASSMTSQVSAQDITTSVSDNSQNQYSEVSEKGTTKPFQLSFFYPLGTDFINSQENTYDISLNIVGGVTGRSNGIELGTVFNVNKYSAKGLQLSGAINFAGYAPGVKEESNVVQLSSMINYAKAGQATQLTGGINISDRSVLQASAIGNFAKESPIQLTGGINITKTGSVQASAIANVAEKSHFQATGGVNLTKDGAFQGSAIANTAMNSACQITGGINVTKKGGFQASAIANVAQESSCQITGGINVTKRGGFQLGIINVRDSADGVSLGIINIANEKKGGVIDFGLEGGDLINMAATFRSGTHRLYSILSVGYGFNEPFISAGFGLGTSFRFTRWLGLNTEFMYNTLYELPNGWENYNSLVQFRPLLNIRVAEHFKIYGGPTANLLIQYNYNSSEYGITPRHVLASSEFDNTRLSFWIGFVGGIKF